MQRTVCSRRQIICGSGGIALLVAADAFGLEPRWLQVTEHDIPVANLPKALEGYQIAQITDAHLRHIGLVEEAIIQEIRCRNVSLVVLTGDMIDNTSRLSVLEEFCRRLRDNQRTIQATLGNWEHWACFPVVSVLT